MWRDLLIWLISLFLQPDPKPDPVPEPPKPDPVPEPPKPDPKPDPVPDNLVLFNLMKLHNEHRQQKGLPLLKLSTELSNAAQKHSDWMNSVKKLSHTGSNNSNPGERIRAEGYVYTTYGENIAYGYKTYSSVFQGWLNSPGHRSNIENSKFKNIGLGVTNTYWTVVFASTNKMLVEEFYLPEVLVNEEIDTD